MIDRTIPDDAMGLYPVNGNNIKATRGMNLIRTIEDFENNRNILVFNDEYRKINVDVVVHEGKFYISPEYGETMDRKNIFYVYDRSAENVSRFERFR